jgi:hypothetical protein
MGDTARHGTGTYCYFAGYAMSRERHREVIYRSLTPYTPALFFLSYAVRLEKVAQTHYVVASAEKPFEIRLKINPGYDAWLCFSFGGVRFVSSIIFRL